MASWTCPCARLRPWILATLHHSPLLKEMLPVRYTAIPLHAAFMVSSMVDTWTAIPDLCV